jgi:hypothetical protein
VQRDHAIDLLKTDMELFGDTAAHRCAFGRLVFVLAFPFEGAPLGDRAPRLALRSAFGFSG